MISNWLWQKNKALNLLALEQRYSTQLLIMVSFSDIFIEIKHALEIPDPARYTICENQTKTRRAEQRSMGSDIKSN